MDQRHKTSPPSRDFYDEVNDSSWKIEKICKGFGWTIKEYYFAYADLAMWMKDAGILEESLAFYVNKAQLQSILADMNMNTRLGPNTPEAPVLWRLKALTELTHKVNTNATKQRRKRRDPDRDVVCPNRRVSENNLRSDRTNVLKNDAS